MLNNVMLLLFIVLMATVWRRLTPSSVACVLYKVSEVVTMAVNNVRVL